MKGLQPPDIIYELAVRLQPRRKDPPGLKRMCDGLRLRHDHQDEAYNAAKLIAEHCDVLSVSVDHVIRTRVAVFGYGQL